MVEFLLVGAVITALGLGLLQYSLLFHSKNIVNHATFMAARAGAIGHAQQSKIRDALEKNLLPLYGGGQTAAELAIAYGKAKADAATNLSIELLSPTKESFDDFADPELKDSVGAGKRVIPNRGLAFQDAVLKTHSGQTLHDANQIKLRVVYGYKPAVPFVDRMMLAVMRQFSGAAEPFHQALLARGRIPIVVHVTQQMLSDAIEDSNISNPGNGNGGQPTDPGPPSQPPVPPNPGGPGNPGNPAPPDCPWWASECRPCQGNNCPTPPPETCG
ncbi:hypothetical protein HNP55_001150 [Paucibacter oligotrophus]|uniref:TadE-like domain-containing protein n=1 Tax=Roseateles oligotrophus TaxID=1769250 RepID=A0A840L7K0_9BURK|nr:TadE/TadG family type IV pilus assembly protein [Roseateles oligotrophus]MBB4842635.1 hypothetical protein [Roseateles oligotrophus]